MARKIPNVGEKVWMHDKPQNARGVGTVVSVA